jgi:hypothetical protein
MLKSLVGLTIILNSSSLLAQDEPDLTKERRFHAIYESYGQNPTSDEVWQNAVNTSKAQTYDIQSGDNLWSLSQTLFADPNFWPKIWSLNSSAIENPHEVLPGQVLQFVPGSIDQAPQMAVGDSAPEPEAAVAKPVVTEEEMLAGVTLPPPKYESKPLSNLPSSLPSWKYRGSQEPALKFESLGQATKDFGSPELSLGNYIVESDVQSPGEVLGAEGGNRTAIDFQYITVRLANGAPADKRMLVVKVVDHLKDPVTGRRGKVLEVQGEVEIGDVVNQAENLYRALVVKSLSLVEKGGMLVSGSIPTYNSSDDGQVIPIAAQVIGGNGGKGQLFGTENLIYLNIGSAQGLIPGQSLNIFRKVPVRDPESESIENQQQIGKVKIVNASENFSTAIVTRASDGIRSGDITVALSSGSGED